MDCLGSVQALVEVYNELLISAGNITEIWEQTSKESKLKWLELIDQRGDAHRSHERLTWIK